MKPRKKKSQNNRRMQESIMAAVKVDVPEVKVELYRPEPSVWNKMGNAVVGALEAGDRFAYNVLYPIYSGLILYIPAVGFTNDVHTLAYDEDIYGNHATSFDKGIAVADLATFGIAKCLKILSITNRLCKIVGYGNTTTTTIGVYFTSKNNYGK